MTRGLAFVLLAVSATLLAACYLAAVGEWDRDGWPPAPGGEL